MHDMLKGGRKYAIIRILQAAVYESLLFEVNGV